MTNRGAPTPPIAFDVDAATVSARFASSDSGALAADVLARLRAACVEVIDDPAARVEAGRDWWPLAMIWARQAQVPALPAVVARPTSAAEVAALLAACNEARVPVTPVAGRSGVCGASVPVHGGVALDLTAMAGIADVDQDSLVLTVLPGTFGDVLEDELRGVHGVTLGHWPQSMALSTVGGWVACRSAGQYSTRYGKIEDMVLGLDVVLADGRLVSTGGSSPRQAVGPDLTSVFVGSEGTLGVVTEARLTVHPLPPAEARAAYGFASFAEGLDACRRILRRGATPAVLRLYDERESKRNGAEDTNLLLVLDEGEHPIVDAVMGIVADECASASRLDDGLVERWLGHRNDVSGLETAIRQDVVVDTTEIAGPWAALPRIYDDARAALKAVPGVWVASAHQSHAYTSGACLYFTWAGQPVEGQTPDDLYRAAWDAVTAATLRHGGALSHHHGIGLNRGRFMPEALGPAFDVLVSLKAALDPAGILNPGKLGLPSPFGAVAWP